jgi:hypothetical protein
MRDGFLVIGVADWFESNSFASKQEPAFSALKDSLEKVPDFLNVR